MRENTLKNACIYYIFSDYMLNCDTWNDLYSINGAYRDYSVDTKKRYVEILNSREGNEENETYERACKVRKHGTFDDCLRTENFIEILRFRHFHRHIVFTDEGEKMRNKEIKDYINVSVVVDIEWGDTI